MGIYGAKAMGWMIVYYAHKGGHCHTRIMKFKLTEMIALVGIETVAHLPAVKLVLMAF